MIDRRFFMRGIATAACSVAAHPFLSTVTLAQSDGAAPLGDHRLVVIILRGAMDGLDAVQPVGDPLFAQMRPTLGTGGGTIDLDGQFGLHAALGGLKPMWDAGNLGFVHATSTPYRDKRSHFDGQDLLEAGHGHGHGAGGGARWLVEPDVAGGAGDAGGNRLCAGPRCATDAGGRGTRTALDAGCDAGSVGAKPVVAGAYLP